MIVRTVGSMVALTCAIAAQFVLPPSWANVREIGAWFVRPIGLPLAWNAMEEAQRAGDPAEAFARGQRALQLLPSWTDGHAVFAYRYVLDAPATGDDPAAHATATRRRMQTALAWLEAARADAGRHEVDLLLTMASLPEVAAMQQPALRELLRDRGGTAAIADDYLAAAERLRPSAAIREQRTFLLPRLAAGLLANGARDRAVEVLATAIQRSDDVADRELAAEWRTRLDEVRRSLLGDTTVDLSAVRADPRLAPLVPFLR